MPVGYSYPRKEPWDGPFVRAIIERDVAKPVLGITERNEEIVVYFESELTSAQKLKLDAIMASPPTPVRYSVELITPEDVEAEVGVKPVRIDIDPTSGLGRIDFEVELTSAQLSKLKTLLASPKKLRKKS